MSATPHTETSTGGETAVSRRRHAVRIGAIVAVGLAAAFVGWLFLGRGDEASTEPAAITFPASVPSVPAARPSIVSLDRLRASAAANAVPIYWIGSRPAAKIELTSVPGNTVFVRYVPAAARAGDSRRFLTVATYARRPSAFAEVEHAAQSAKTRTIKLAGGGIAVYDPARPTNVHLAYPGQSYQIEVYAPERGLAVRLVESGAVRPVD